MHIAVVGSGLVGSRAVAMLAARGHRVSWVGHRNRPQLGEINTRDQGRVTVLASSPGALAIAAGGAGDIEAVVLATESMHQVTAADPWLRLGVPVVSTADRPRAVRALLLVAREHRVNQGPELAVGAAYSPGLSTLLAAQLAEGFERVDSITTARFGTGGPTCAREHHRTMAAPAWQVRDGTGRFSRGGTGRTLVWFPEPVGPNDCYLAGLAEPFLLRHRFPQVAKIQALQAATRRDRLTARLPMLRPPHAEGLLGAVWVEVRGRRSTGEIEHRALAATAPQATGAAAVAAVIAERLARAPRPNRAEAGRAEPVASAGTGWLGDPRPALSELVSEVTLWGPDADRVARHRPSGPVQVARKWRLSREDPTGPPMDLSSRNRP